jgi:hypothetical protein
MMHNAGNKRRKRALEFDTLESMTLLSGVTAWVHGSVAPVSAMVSAATVQAKALPVAVNGFSRGVASFQNRPDVGTTYSLGTFGPFSGLGRAVVSGTLHTVGFIAQGQATGTLTLYAHRGSLTLTLTGPTQPGFSPLPSSFLFSITGSTGRLAGATGNGTVDVSFRPFLTRAGALSGTGKIVLTFHANSGATA